MQELTFYRQARHDGGIRTGIELDGVTTLLSVFQEGRPEQRDDPLGSSLVWYVDLRCRGEDLPTEPEAARSWFLDRRESIVEGLSRLADLLAAGKDDSFPLRWSDFPAVPPGVQMEVVCSTIRRLTGHDLAEILREISTHIEEYLRQVAPPVVLHH